MLLIAMAAAFVLIGLRLTFIQGVSAQGYLAVGRSEWTHTVTLAAERGAVLDRSGNELAMSIPQTTIYADPRSVTDPTAEATALSPVLGVGADALRSRLVTGSRFVYLARTVDDATAAKVALMHLAGVYSLQEPKRFYPAGTLAQPLLGAVGTDGGGLGGLESMYNSQLKGAPGKLIEEIDPNGGQIPGGLQEYQAPVAGNDVVLTIDEPLQYDAESALAQAIVAAHAKSGIALMMNSTTGEVLADAQLTMPDPGNAQPPAVSLSVPTPPTTTPPTGGTAGSPPLPVEAASSTSFTQVYEPGSVNKLITISAALAEHVIQPSDTFTIPDTYPVAGTDFHDAENHGVKHWTVTDILANSSNIGTIQIAQKLGKTRLLHYVNSFGEGNKTDVNFPGESAGLLPTYWSGTSIADVPIGQGIGVTAMQMLAAYNTVANGGAYIAPRLVRGTLDAKGRLQAAPPPAIHRVVSPEVAKEMTAMLGEVVRVGTGQAADLSPYTVAGKTGTASVPAKGGYEAGHYVASFAGFVPAEKPAITAMVVINDTPDFGAAASAPTFATIARDALQKLEVPPQTPVAPPAGVPLATPASATGAGEVAGTPLPGLGGTAPVPTSTTSSTVPTVTTATTAARPVSSPAQPTTTQPAATSTTTTVRKRS
ncbi:MAG: penicillin-binding protein 2 [Actinomycetota bacterium]|nr:penicillin-binding protein 2 [Actinomycetota bacterium]